VLVDIVSFFCAQAPKLRAPANTATIMIALSNFTNISPPSLAGCCRLLGGEDHRRNDFLLHLFQINKTDSGFDNHRRLFVYQIKQLDDIGVCHANAPVAGRLANLILVVCAMNIDVAIARIRIVLLKAVQPEDPRHYLIIVWRGLFGLVNWLSVSENSAAECVITDFLSDTELANGRFHAPLFGADAESRGGDRVPAKHVLSGFDRKALIAH
jgi:hypothetical protein